MNRNSQEFSFHWERSEHLDDIDTGKTPAQNAAIEMSGKRVGLSVLDSRRNIILKKHRSLVCIGKNFTPPCNVNWQIASPGER